MITDILGAVFMSMGLFVIAVSVLGVFRMKTILTRMHAASLLDTMGLFLTLLGAAFFMLDVAGVLKLVLVLVLMWIAAPLTTHLIAKMEFYLREGRLLNKEDKSL
ncbi:MAG: monovalent cation/H(+) antiporter subunit G [Ruminococcaceae bacterium]|nr:monovalent cation/H(+) antiporter subunit G [Oscillospiraceae bacterium]